MKAIIFFVFGIYTIYTAAIYIAGIYTAKLAKLEQAFVTTKLVHLLCVNLILMKISDNLWNWQRKECKSKIDSKFFG